MAVNLIDNEQIHIIQNGSDITLNIQNDALKNEDVVVGSIRSKNMFNKGQIYLFKGYIDGSGKLISNDTNYCLIFPFEKVGTFTFSFSIISNRIRIAEYNSFTATTNTQLSLLGESDANVSTLTFTTTPNCKYLYIAIGNTTAITNIDTALNSIQIETGNTATPYTPYDTYSNKDLANEDVVVGSIRSKNIFLPLGSTTINGITFTKNANGTYNISGTATANAGLIIYEDLDESSIIQGTTYTLSANIPLPTGIEARLEAYNGTTWLRHLIGGTLSSSNQTYTGSANLTNATRIRYGLHVSNGTTVNITGLGIQLEEGDTTTTFSPYQNLKGEENYSLNEIKIGTWIDGKPLYRNVVSFTTASSGGDVSVDLSSLNIKRIIKIDGSAGNDNSTKPLNFYFNGNSISTRYTNGTMYINASSSYGSLPGYLIIEYTKTTD